MKRDRALAKQRGRSLPQVKGKPMLADGGLETTLVFHKKIDLPHFASFPLLETRKGREILADYYRGYAAIAHDRNFGFVFESPTWRANSDWSGLLGYSPAAQDRLNVAGIDLMKALRQETGFGPDTAVVSGCVGPRGDGYVPDMAMSADEARHYHAPQVDSFRRANADMISAMTIGTIEEAAGIIMAAGDSSMPVVVSFTVETDGALPSGTSLRDAIVETDRMTGRIAAYYMVNCAHPTHFAHVLSPGARWQERIGGIRANASCKSHAELDEATELDAGDPDDLARRSAELLEMLPNVVVIGGCCGTDERHIRAMAAACKCGTGRRQAA